MRESDNYVFGDASDIGYALLITQCNTSTRNLLLMDRSHVPIGCWSGLFKGAEKRWDISSREIYPFLIALSKYHHFLHRDEPFQIITDNRNLKHILSPNGYNLMNNPLQRNRIYRWSLAFMAYRYEVHVISGDQNYFCDLISRWGQKEINISDNIATIQNIQKENELTKNHPIFIVDSTISIPYPSMTEIISIREQYGFKDHEGVLEIPDYEDIRLRIFIIGHMHLGGHFGPYSTTKVIKEKYIWENIEKDIELWCSRCCHCISAKTNRIIKRPWGSTIRGSYPNEVLTMDYLYLGMHDDDGLSPYLLILKDDFSMYTRMMVCKTMTADEAVEHLISWILLFGPPALITTDQGSQFTSEIFKQLTNDYQIKHHIGAIEVHHNMGSIERTNKQIIELF